jgi:hypothetical protein
MGLSLSSDINTIFLSCFVISFFCSSRAASTFHSFVRAALQAFFRPDRMFPSPSRAVAVKDGASSAPPKACP